MKRRLGRTLLFILAVLFIILFSLGAAAVYVDRQVHALYPEQAPGTIFEIPRGAGTRDIVRLLENKKVIPNQYVALTYVFYKGLRHKLQAGEYLFDRPTTPAEVLTRIAEGNVYLHKFTVPEGLTIAETAQKWEEAGFGPAGVFEKEATAVDLIRDLDPKAQTLEGYLFPETYFFPAHTTAHQAVETMVGRFRTIVQRLQKEVPPSRWPLNMRGTVILASIIESEAARADERPLVASVYINRIERNILLQCDPTVIYALQQADRYHGKLSLADLKFASPYNTYVNPGLPPGPIMNPGYPSLRAAIEPATTKYLYFVRTTDGRHTFSENLAAHNRAVAAYRLLQRRSK